MNATKAVITKRFRPLDATLPTDVLHKVEREVADFRAKRINEETARYLREQNEESGALLNFSVRLSQDDADRIGAIAIAHDWPLAKTLQKLIVAALDARLIK